MSSRGIPVVCGCGRIASRLPRPDYDNVSLLEVHCSHCRAVNVITTSHGRVTELSYKGILKQDTIINIEIQSNVPEASGCLQEAIIAVNNGAFRAAAVMSRAALEVSLEYASFDDDMLFEKASHAVIAEAFTAYDYHKAENVRLIGNFGAHGSCARYVPEDALMTEADAKYIVELSSELIRKLIKWRLGE